MRAALPTHQFWIASGTFVAISRATRRRTTRDNYELIGLHVTGVRALRSSHDPAVPATTSFRQVDVIGFFGLPPRRSPVSVKCVVF